MTALGVRVGGDALAPGQARALSVSLPHRRGAAAASDKVPALVITGHQPGPRVTILAGVRGFEVHAARLVSGVEAWLAPDEVKGTGELDDPRARRLMRASGASALVPPKRKRPPSPRPEGGPVEAIQLELAVPSFAAAALPVDGALDGGAAVLARLLHMSGAWSPA